MTEATNCVVAFLFKQVGYRRIIGWCDVANTASSLVLSAVGGNTTPTDSTKRRYLWR